MANNKIYMIGRNQGLKEIMVQQLEALGCAAEFVSTEGELIPTTDSSDAVIVVEDGLEGLALVKSSAKAGNPVLWAAPSCIPSEEYKNLQETEQISIGFLRRYDYLYEQFKGKVERIAIFGKMQEGSCAVRIPVKAIANEKIPSVEDLLFRLTDGFSYLLSERIIAGKIKDSSVENRLGDKVICEFTTESDIIIEVTVDTGDFESEENFEIALERGKFQFFASLNEQKIHKDAAAVKEMLTDWLGILAGKEAVKIGSCNDACRAAEAVELLLK